MIDWIDLEIDIEHEPLGDEYYKRFVDDTEIAQVCFNQQVYGSYSSVINVKSMNVRNGIARRLKIFGNPLKWKQGHNLFGTNNVQSLCRSLILDILSVIGLDTSEDEAQAINDGRYLIRKIHITECFQLKTVTDVLHWIEGVFYCSKSNHKDKTLYENNTLYFGKGSRRWTVKIYSKGKELERHPLPRSLAMRGELERFAQNLLRVELELETMELKDMGLKYGSDWKEGIPEKLFNEKMQDIVIPENIPLSDEKLLELPHNYRGTYLHWAAGKSMEGFFNNRQTRKKHRDKLREYGIDISVPPRNAQESNVIPMWRRLILEPVQVPEWAYETPLFFERKLDQVSNIS